MRITGTLQVEVWRQADGESEGGFETHTVTGVSPQTTVLELLDLPPGVGVSGLEADGGDRFYCGGGSSGKVRAVRRPR